MNLSEIRKKLSSVNWDFDYKIVYTNEMRKPFNCRKYFSYPATFIPEIPYTLIEILSKKGDVVLDPFGGIGTTFMQSLLLERVPYYYDINPVAVSICKNIYDLFNPLQNIEAMKNEILSYCNNYDSSVRYRYINAEMQGDIEKWYDANTFNELSYLYKVLSEISDPALRQVFKFLLSSILVSASSQNKGWAYIADNVKPKSSEVKKKLAIDQFINSTKTLFNDIITHRRMLSNTFGDFYNEISKEKRIFNHSIIEDNSLEAIVDLIITSPPYPKMIDYVKSQRLVFDFLGEDFKPYIKEETGARCRRNNIGTLNEYKEQIMNINIRLKNTLKENGLLCMVLPLYNESDERKILIDEVISHLIDINFENIYEVERYIPGHRRTLSIHKAKLNREKIYVFKKKGGR